MGCKIHRKLKLRNILASTVASLSTFFDKLYAPLSAGSHHTRAAIMPRINEEGVSTPCRITLKSGESAQAPRFHKCCSDTPSFGRTGGFSVLCLPDDSHCLHPASFHHTDKPVLSSDSRFIALPSQDQDRRVAGYGIGSGAPRQLNLSIPFHQVLVERRHFRIFVQQCRRLRHKRTAAD